MTLQLNMSIDGDPKGAVKAVDVVEKKVEGLERATKKQGQTSSKANAEAAASYDKLRRSVDPVYRAEQELLAVEENLNRAVREGVVTLDDAQVTMDQYTDSLDGGSKGAGSMLGQLGLLFGGLTTGALILKASTFAVEYLTTAWYDNQFSAERAEEATQDLSAAHQNYVTLAEHARASTADLSEEYGSLADNARLALAEQEKFARAEEIVALGNAVGSLTVEYGNLFRTAGASWVTLSKVTYGVKSLTDELDLSYDSAAVLNVALAALAEAEGPEAQRAELENVSAIYAEITDQIGGDLTQAQIDFGKSLNQTLDSANLMLGAQIKLTTGFDEVVAAAGMIGPALDSASGFIDTMIGKGQTLAQTFIDAAAEIATAAAASAETRYIEGLGTSSGRGTVNPSRVDAILAAGGGVRVDQIPDKPRAARPRRSGGGGGASETDKEAEALAKLITGLESEIDILRELDPVERELLELRERMTGATAAEIDQVRDLITIRNEEQIALASNIEQMEGLRSTAHDVWDGITSGIRESNSAGEIFFNLMDNIGHKLTDVAGNKFIDVLFGQSGSSDGGFLGDLFSGLNLFADGGVVGSATMFSYAGGKMGVMGEAGPEAIMPLTHAGQQGVGAIMGGQETTLPLTRLSSGKLGVSIKPFAKGDTFGAFSHPVSQPSQQNARSERDDQRGGRGTVNNYWNVQSDSPRQFAQSRATTARGAEKFIGGMGRFN